jgi:hypothetical protein
VENLPKTLTAPPKRGRDWLDREPGIGRIGRELARLFRRARQRARLVVLVALLAAVSTFTTLIRQPQRFMAQVTFRVVEESTEAIGRPPSPRELRDYILDGIFVKPRLIELIRAHHLYPSKVRKDANWAYEQMRNDLEVDVFRNTFRSIRSSEEVQRSAQLRIRYRALNADLALRVAKDLARLIRDHELDKRRHLSKTAIKVLQLQRSRMLTRLSILERKRARHTIAMLKADRLNRFRLEVEVNHLDREISEIRRRARRFSNLLARATTRAAIEQQGAGLRFKELDWRQFRPHLSRMTISLAGGGVMFMFSLLVVSLLFGAFDPRVYNLEDIRRLGLTPIGKTEPTTDSAEDARLPGGYDSIAFYLLKSGDRSIGLCSVAGSDVPLHQAAVRIGQAIALQTGAATAIVETTRGASGSPVDDQDGEAPGFDTRWLQPRLALLTPASVDSTPPSDAVREIIRQTTMQFTHHLVSLGGLDERGEHLEVLDFLDRAVVLGRAGGFTEHALLQTADQLTPANTLGVILLG